GYHGGGVASIILLSGNASQVVHAVKFCEQIAVLHGAANRGWYVESEPRVNLFRVPAHVLKRERQDGRRHEGVWRAVDRYHLMLRRIELPQVGDETRESFRPRNPLAVKAGFERADLPDDGGNVVL